MPWQPTQANQNLSLLMSQGYENKTPKTTNHKQPTRLEAIANQMISFLCFHTFSMKVFALAPFGGARLTTSGLAVLDLKGFLLK